MRLSQPRKLNPSAIDKYAMVFVSSFEIGGRADFAKTSTPLSLVTAYQ
jgi:hypothetical protein